MTWTLTARILPSNVPGTYDEQYRKIWGGLYDIVSQGDALRIFDWVELDLSATFVGVISEGEPPPEVVEQLKGIHEFMGNVKLDEEQVVFALRMVNPI